MTTPPQSAPPSGAPTASVLHRLRELTPTLNPTMLRVAEAILTDPTSAGTLAITALAQQADAAPATVSRLATRLGFEGWPALRSAIATENGRAAGSGWGRDIGSEIAPEDSPRAVLDVLAGTAASALRTSSAELDLDQVARAAEAIARADHVHLHGEWGDGIPARELYLRLLRIGVPAWIHDGGSTTLAAVRNTLGARDVVLVLNRSGDAPDDLAFVERSREQGATTIAVHGAPDSPLAATVEISVFTGVRNGGQWTQNFAGRTSDMLATSLIWLLVAQIRSADASMRYITDGTFPPAPDTSRT
jgi:DNA-binding MurR/RpiR family transcriptional regulator